ARNRRNYFFVAILLLMALAQLGVHLNALGVLSVPGWAGISLAMDVMLFVLSVMGGRVIPMFTNNAIPGAKAVRHPWVERLALGLVLLLLVADAAQVAGIWLALLAALATLAHLLRLWMWQPWKTLNTPLVWVLHAAYAWIVLHLAFRAMAAMEWLSVSAGNHALTAGAIGSMVIGMMTRTALGHTGRKLVAGKTEVACYTLVATAAVVRVFAPLMNPAWLTDAVLVAALLWSTGFALYTWRYWAILSRD
ncbi:MAG: NnrS family protein, partial [Hylemonella sp.]|nr:NnrS family protein [Hylemonella sp.]